MTEGRATPGVAGIVPWTRDDEGALLVGLVRRGDALELPSRELRTEHPLAAALSAARRARVEHQPPGPRLETAVAGTAARAWFWPVRVRTPQPQLAWVPLAQAAHLLPGGLDGLAASLARPASRQVLLVRHARAGQRAAWRGPDADRPLDSRGQAQASALVGLLGAYDVQRIHSSDSRRCLETVGPLAAALGLPVLAEPLLSEEGSADDPAGAARVLADVIARPDQAVVCTQRKTLDRVLPDLLAGLGADESAAVTPRKGGVLVLHLPVQDPTQPPVVEPLEPPPS